MRKSPIYVAAFLVFSAAIGCAKKTDDAALVTNIKSQMFSDTALKGASLDVTSQNGAVTLTGDVPSDAAHLEAYKIASQTEGVTKVDDQLVVQPMEAAQGTSTKDSPLPAMPKSAVPVRKKEQMRRTDRESDHSPDRLAYNEPPTPGPGPYNDAQNGQPSGAPTSTTLLTSGQMGGQTAPPPEAPVAVQPTPVPTPPPPPPQPRQVTIQAGSTMTIRMIDGVDSSVNHAGEIFHASLDFPLVVSNQVAVPAGADVYVRLASASSAGHMTGTSELHLELIKLEFQGQSYPLVSSTYSVVGDSRGKNTAEKVGGGAVLGAIIGAIAGGGKGAAIGAGVGGGAGGVYQGATKGKQVKVPSETKLDFQLDQPVTVTVMPRPNPAQ